MPVVYSPSLLPSDSSWETRAGGPDTGALTWSIPGGAANADVCTARVAVLPGTRLRAALTLSAPTGPAWGGNIRIAFWDAAAAIATTWSPDTTITTTPQTLIVDAVAPPGTIAAWVSVRVLAADNTLRHLLLSPYVRRQATPTATTLWDINQPMGNTILDTPAGRLLNTAPARLGVGRCTYLAATPAAALEIQRVYEADRAYLNDELLGNNILHTATNLRQSTERALNGVPARMLVTADIALL